jgi:hypothetical protein
MLHLHMRYPLVRWFILSRLSVVKVEKMQDTRYIHSHEGSKECPLGTHTCVAHRQQRHVWMEAKPKVPHFAILEVEPINRMVSVESLVVCTQSPCLLNIVIGSPRYARRFYSHPRARQARVLPNNPNNPQNPNSCLLLRHQDPSEGHRQTSNTPLDSLWTG